MKFPELGTDRLSLVEIGRQHSESLFDILSRDEVTRYGGIEALVRFEEYHHKGYRKVHRDCWSESFEQV